MVVMVVMVVVVVKVSYSITSSGPLPSLLLAFAPSYGGGGA